MKQKKILMNQYVNFVSNYDLDVFSTITLKLAILDDTGSLRFINEDYINNTALFIRERLYRKFSKNDRNLPFLVFVEGGGDKRHHIHILSKKPDQLEFFDYARLLFKKARASKWVNKEIDIQQIAPGTKSNVIGYCLKEGSEAINLAASYFG